MRLSTEARVGLVVLVGVALLTYMTFTVGGWRFGIEKGYRLYADFDTVAGLDPKAPVKLAGVEVGKVEEIALVDNRARVTMRIQPNIKIRRGAQAALRATGLLGEKYLEILPGEGEGFLAAEDTIEQTEKAADLDRLINQASAIAADIKAVSASLREALGTKEGEKSLKEIVANIRELSRNLSATIKKNEENFSQAIANFKDFSQNLKDETPGLIARIDEMTQKLSSIADKLEKGEGTLGKLITEEDLYNKLDSTLDSLDKVGQRLEKGEGTIGKLLTDEKAYDQLTTTLEGLSSAMGRIERFKTLIGFRNEYQLNEGDNKGYFSLQLQPRPDKFYLLELVDDPRGEVNETVTQIDSGEPVVKLETKHRLKFSALFGKRFADLTLRAGLMENTFGVGADYFLFSDRIRFSIDAWDFNSDDPESERAHLKATGSYTMFKYLFVQGGYDNFLNRDIDNYFAGGGIRFEDDDLKYLLGSAPVRLR
jgi:phospholipid/cholesterol/gamma-HCH transport system substrate-binding protein